MTQVCLAQPLALGPDLTAASALGHAEGHRGQGLAPKAALCGLVPTRRPLEALTTGDRTVRRSGHTPHARDLNELDTPLASYRGLSRRAKAGAG